MEDLDLEEEEREEEKSLESVSMGDFTSRLRERFGLDRVIGGGSFSFDFRFLLLPSVSMNNQNTKISIINKYEY